MSISDSNFEQLISEGRTVVLFSARTSGTAKRMSGYLTKLKLEDKSYLADSAECRNTCARLGIRSIPTTAIFQDGKLVACNPGVLNEEDFLKFCK
jgi:thioredoxin-like negative regulator of GroEL